MIDKKEPREMKWMSKEVSASFPCPTKEKMGILSKKNEKKLFFSLCKGKTYSLPLASSCIEV
jgi:hypothetical protein